MLFRHRHFAGGAGFRLPLLFSVAAGAAALILVAHAGAVRSDFAGAATTEASRPGSLLRLRAAASRESDAFRSHPFPDRLIAYGPRSRPSFRPQAWLPAPSSARGNAAWDPSSPLGPSVLGARRRAHAEAMLTAGDPQAMLRAYASAKAEVEPDTLRVLVLRIDFLKDTPGHKSTGDGRFDLRRDDESRAIPIDPPPHDRRYFDAQMEALSRYYRVQSGGALVLKWDIFPAENDSAYHLPDTRKYGPWIWSNSNPDVFIHIIDFVGDALAAADRDSTLVFEPGPIDPENPYYRGIVIFHAGTDLQGDINGDTPWDIPSLNLYVQDPFVVQDSTVGINYVQIVPETANQDGFWGALNGVVTHEFGHQIGFDDLYDVTTGISMVGAFSLMDSGENLYGYITDPDDSTDVLPVRGTLPGSVDPWHKIRFFPDGVDLVTPESFVSGDSSRFAVTLPSAQLSPSEGGNRILYVPLNLSEYLLVENRVWELNGDSLIVLKSDRETGVILGPVPADTLAPATDLGYREYDYLLPAQGITAWHVDNLAIQTGYSSPYGGVNIYYSRPGVAVLEADGIRDIGAASEEYIGGPYDTWYLGGYTCLGPETVPSSRTNDGTPSGITMCALDSIGVIARISVDLGLGPAGWPVAMSGEPAEEQVVVADSRDEGREAGLFVAAGNKVYAWRPDGLPWREDGGADGEAYSFDLPVDQGLAVSEMIPGGEPHGGRMLAIVAGGILHLVSLDGSDDARWPEGTPGDSLVTATPVLAGRYAWIGCGDGTIRALDRAAGGGQAARRLSVASGAVRVLGAGWLHEEGAEGDETCFWATDRGEAGAASWSGPGSEPRTLFRAEPARVGATPAGALAIPAGSGGEARILFAWSDGTIEWRTTAGALLDGWPASLGAPPAGSPIVCDADADGVLETVVADRRGRVHCLGVNGVEEFGWPRSLWSEDERQPPDQKLGVRAIDLDGVGGPEILVHRADGFLVALDGRGERVPGWPRALGADGRVGPEWIAASPSHGARLGYGIAYSPDSTGAPRTVVGVTRVEAARGIVAGAFPAAGFDASRTRVVPATLLPIPSGEPVAGPRTTLRLYPNPLRGDLLTVRFTLDRPARVRLAAYDLSGDLVAELDAAGQVGPDGNHLPWDWGGLASGLYQVRAQFLGHGWTEELFDKVAVVR